MSHGDSITAPPEGFSATAQTDSTAVRRPRRPGRHLYGIQFHPEVAHTPARPRRAPQLRRRPRGVIPNWTPASFIESTVARSGAASTSMPARSAVMAR